MNAKKILCVIAIVFLVILASYLFTKNEGKEQETIKQVDVKQSLVTAQTIKPKVTFIELGSVGCTPCDMMRPILDEIEKEYEGQVIVRFYDVKSILGGPYAGKYRVQFIPTQVFLDKNGIEYYRHVGFLEKAEVIKVLQMQGVK